MNTDFGVFAYLLLTEHTVKDDLGLDSDMWVVAEGLVLESRASQCTHNIVKQCEGCHAFFGAWGPKSPHKHEDPTNHDLRYPPCRILVSMRPFVPLSTHCR